MLEIESLKTIAGYCENPIYRNFFLSLSRRENHPGLLFYNDTLRRSTDKPYKAIPVKVENLRELLLLISEFVDDKVTRNTRREKNFGNAQLKKLRTSDAFKIFVSLSKLANDHYTLSFVHSAWFFSRICSKYHNSIERNPVTGEIIYLPNPRDMDLSFNTNNKNHQISTESNAELCLYAWNL